MNKAIIFSGIQPSGNLHIGNYLGAIKQWVGLQDDPKNELLFCVVDQHAITVPQDPKMLREKNLELSALYIACGLNPQKSNIFIQSENPNHSYLTWIFDCITPMGWMERMTQYKDKSSKQGERTSVGLFHYPNLMACDILLYDADLVPVGEDQTQHIELTCDIADKFNRTFGEVFKKPKIMVNKSTARLMSLQNPHSKMSKSDENQNGTINLLDTPDEITKKIKRAVTDSGTEITYSNDKPALSNLLSIYTSCTGKSIAEIEKMYVGKGYADFKNDLAEVVVAALAPIQQKYQELRSDDGGLQKILDGGRDYAIEKSSKKIVAVKNAVGLGR